VVDETNQEQQAQGPKGKAPKPPKAEKTCAMPGCDVKFMPRSINPDERFHSHAHKIEYWHMASQLGDRILRGDMGVSGKSQKQCVLEALRSGKWIALGRMFPYVNLNCVSRLRKFGHDIRCRIIFRDELNRREYQYKLMAPVPQSKGEES
jgi:hypothetical protein